MDSTHEASNPRPGETSSAPVGPVDLQVEVTGSCNLSCTMCLVAYRPRLGRSASMTLPDVVAILDDLPTVRRLTLQGLGEPLLAPDLDRIVTEATRRGIEVGFNTNGTLLTRERSERLIDAGVDWIHVSLDGATADTYATIRRGGRLEAVLANVRDLVAARQARGLRSPWVQINVVAMRANRDEVVALVRMAADLRVDRLWVQGLSHDFSDVADDVEFVAIRAHTDAQLLRDDELDDVRASALAVAAELGVDLRLPAAPDGQPRHVGEPACDWPDRGVYVNHEGSVQPCCMLMGRNRGVMGHLADQPISSMWRGTAWNDLRNALLTDAVPPMCRGCSVYRRRF
jgi:radical SAM protein with 4Fe4S-binding SPASM domain